MPAFLQQSAVHRFAKRVITEARGLVVPITSSASQVLGFNGREEPAILLAFTGIGEEVVVGRRRPDLPAATAAGVNVAIEIAYSSFCDEAKRLDYAQLQLAGLEIDLSAFTPMAFDVTQVKRAILENLDVKSWLWPQHPHVEPPSQVAPASFEERKALPEEVVAVVRAVARTHSRWYRSSYHSWVIPRFRAESARTQLRAIASGAQRA